MTAAGQAMAVLVPIRIASAFQHVDDVDAKNMGLIDDEKQRLEAAETERTRDLQVRAIDGAAFRAEREAFKAGRKAAAAGSGPLQMKPGREKKSLPGFLKVRGGGQDEAAGADADQDRAAVADAPTAPASKRPRTDPPGAGAPGAAGSAAAPVPLGMGLAGYASESSSGGEEAEEPEDEEDDG
mmetsp:Transcript_86908/g.246393  ORF Transcript_86908/g.246393 Transcript_86908/m.246393 type:complete len:183 (+) Transcript_86908:64-612(+)